MRDEIKEMIINSLVNDGILDGNCKISEAINVRYGFDFNYRNYCGSEKRTNFNTSQIIVKAGNSIYTITVNERTELNTNDVSFDKIEKFYSAVAEQRKKEEMYRRAKNELTKAYQERIEELKRQFDIKY